jgi:ABC-2 type transport system permease protein
MSPVTNAVFMPAIVGSRETAPAPARAPRPFYWSVRRELWENRSIVVAPLAIATFAVVALVVHAITMPSHMPGLLANDPASGGSAFSTYTIASILTLLTMPVVGAFYCVDALSGERRDRSILFWKSLPVSDRTTVLAKAAIPLLVLPLITFAATLAMHVTLLLLSVAALLVQGESAAPLWRELQLWRMWPSLLFALGATALWLAPVYACLLLVSGWARRTAALWAVLPLLALGVLEKLAFDTLYVQALVQHRVFGWYFLAFVPTKSAPLSSSTPGRFLASPALWLGLALAVAFLAAAVLLRRRREPF